MLQDNVWILVSLVPFKRVIYWPSGLSSYGSCNGLAFDMHQLLKLKGSSGLAPSLRTHGAQRLTGKLASGQVRSIRAVVVSDHGVTRSFGVGRGVAAFAAHESLPRPIYGIFAACGHCE